jgi:hypothetical protein
METRRHLALRGLLWFICLYHVACGLLVIAVPDQIPLVAEKLAGLKVSASPEFLYLAKPFAVYAMVFGVMMGVAAWTPVKNRALISIGVVLFALRIVQRLLSLDEVERIFGVPPARSWQTIGIVAALGLALAWLRYRLYREMRADGSDHSA